MFHISYQPAHHQKLEKSIPKTILYENKILSDKTKEGKRGIRVYPTWDLTINKQAQKIQLWQTKYFLDLSPDKEIDSEKVRNLLSLEK